jgi:hypothetical protein
MAYGTDEIRAGSGNPYPVNEIAPGDETMQELDIQDYARQLLEAHGAKAVAEAAQKARALEEQGKLEDAESWRRIESALKLMIGPHQS